MHSSVNVAEWGLKITFLFFRSGFSFSIGSLEKTSKPAPNNKFSFKAFSKSSSLMIPPRAVLTIIVFFLFF